METKKKMMQKVSVAGLATAVILAGVALTANAGVIPIPAASFTPQAGLITFSEFPLGTVNPVYTPADYGGGAGAPNVNFGGFFAGQMQPGTSPPCPAGAALTGCVTGTPSSPLALDPNSPATFITTDGANPTSPVLSGTPIFNGSIAILFDVDLVGVGLDAGFFNAVGGTAIEVFDRQGTSLGSVTNTGLGIEFLGLVTDNGQPKIAGMLFHLVGAEPAGFAIDNVRFARAGQVVIPGVPEPATLLLLGSGLVGMTGIAWRRRR